MPEETENTTEEKTPTDTPSTEASLHAGTAMESARDKLLHEIASNTNIKEPGGVPPKQSGEEAFMQYTANAQAVEQPTEPPAPPTEKMLEQLPPRKKERIIRTYHSDVAETIQQQKLSMADMAIAEQKEREKEPPPTAALEPAHASLKKIALTTGGIVLIAVSALLVGYFYRDYQANKPLPVVAPANTFMPTNAQQVIDVSELSREELIAMLTKDIAEAPGSINDIVDIALVKGSEHTPITAEEFFTLIGADVDPALLRSLEDPFMLGVHIFDAPHPFLILKTTFFENAFAGMLRWEERIAEDLPFFVPTPMLVTLSPPATASTSTSTTSELVAETQPKTFQDIIVQNKDARAREGSLGEYDIVYSFTDPETLIITTNTKTLATLFERLTVSRFER